jgi:ribosomal protein S18 acetylase RimI-like enzyme
MFDINIRAASLRDLDGVYQVFLLSDTLHRQVHPEIFQQTLEPETTKEYLISAIKSKDAALFIAEHRDEIVGGILAWVCHTPNNPVFVPRKYLNIENLIVAQGFRRQGIGKALMEHIQHWSEERGIEQIQLTVWDFNQAAREFYKNLGYLTLHCQMRKDLT